MNDDNLEGRKYVSTATRRWRIPADWYDVMDAPDEMRADLIRNDDGTYTVELVPDERS